MAQVSHFIEIIAPSMLLSKTKLREPFYRDMLARGIECRAYFGVRSSVAHYIEIHALSVSRQGMLGEAFYSTMDRAVYQADQACCGVHYRGTACFASIWASPLGVRSLCHVMVIRKNVTATCNFKGLRWQRHSTEI